MSNRRVRLRRRPPWRNAARGKIILHVYRTDGRGHGSEGSRLKTDFEIRLERVDEE